jgi:hypothetical protein
MSGHLFDKYGAILAEDVEVLEKCLEALCNEAKPLAGSVEAIATRQPQPVVRVCEIGMHDGGTARGIEGFVNTRGCTLHYYGIDPDDGSTRPRYIPPGGAIMVGKSQERFVDVPDVLDLVWVDGCHCAACVVADLGLFAPKVREGGFLCLHDTNPRGQFRRDLGHQYHGTLGNPYFALAVRKAMELVQFPWPNWELFAEGNPPEEDRMDCGTMAFRRLK